MAKAGFYRANWRRTLSYPAGAVPGAAVTLGMGTSTGHWAVAFLLVLIGALVPWPARYDTAAARETAPAPPSERRPPIQHACTKDRSGRSPACPNRGIAPSTPC